MAYNANKEVADLTKGNDGGIIDVLTVAEHCKELLSASGAFTARQLMQNGKGCGDSFRTLACLDFLCKYGFLFKVLPDDGGLYKSGSRWSK